MLDSHVLVLNRTYTPVNVITVRRAFALFYQNAARAVDENYILFDFESWSRITEMREDESIGLVGRRIKIPRVLLLVSCDVLPRREVKFCRHNIYQRDRNRCQYCGRAKPRSELNLDHIIPRSQGGTSTWSNVVCCCLPCNQSKGGRTPEQAGMRLIRKPLKPRWSPLMFVPKANLLRKEWEPFLVNTAYWNTELLVE